MDKENKTKSESDKKTKEEKQVRLEVFEEDDYFEEFEDDSKEKKENKGNELDFKHWQSEWEDEEANDNFDAVLKEEIERNNEIKL